MARIQLEDDAYLAERRSSWSDCLAGAVLAGLVFLLLFALPFIF